MAPSYTRTSTADYGDATSTADSGGRWYDVISNSVRADSLDSSNTWTDANTYVNTNTYKEKDFEEEERLYKLQEKEELMEGWFPRKPKLRSIKRRLSVQLRGVRRDGRGWA